MTYTAVYASPLGNILLASNGLQLTGLWFENQKYFAAGLGASECRFDLPILQKTMQWLDAYFSSEQPSFTPPLALQGTAFQRSVWQALLRIPYGQTTTYAAIGREIAAAAGRSTFSAQAVGNAVGRNPISIIVPCHRVVGSRGSLTGYAGGLTRKKALLLFEDVDVSAFYTPTRGTAL